jgi:hypothetical protein
VILLLSFFGPDPSDVCDGFYCESQTLFGNDERCENPALILGADNYCHHACGSTTEYCAEDNSYCYRNACVSCPDNTVLFKDGKCYET